MAFSDKILKRFPIINRVIERAKVVSIPGFEKVPVYDVLQFFIVEIKRDVLPRRARSIAFSFFLALFPGMIFLITLIPYIPVENLQLNLIALLEDVLPMDSYQWIGPVVENTLEGTEGNLLFVVGTFLFSLVVSSNGMLAIMESFDKSNATFKKRPWWKTRLLSIQLTAILSGLVITSLVLIVGGKRFINFLLEEWGILNNFNFNLVSFFTFMVVLFIIFNSVSIIYYFAPAVQKKWRYISTGSTVACISIFLISLGFSYFVNNFGNYDKLYGPIGTIIALQLWIYYNSFALLVGFELNNSISFQKSVRTQQLETNSAEA